MGNGFFINEWPCWQLFSNQYSLKLSLHYFLGQGTHKAVADVTISVSLPLQNFPLRLAVCHYCSI